MSTRLYGSSPVQAAQLVFEASPGGQYLAGAGTITSPGGFGSILALTASVVNITSAGNGAIRGTLTSVSIPAGVRVPGQFQSIAWVSGSIIAYDNP